MGVVTRDVSQFKVLGGEVGFLPLLPPHGALEYVVDVLAACGGGLADLFFVQRALRPFRVGGGRLGVEAVGTDLVYVFGIYHGVFSCLFVVRF